MKTPTVDKLASEIAAREQTHKREMADVLKPSVSLLCKLGSIAVHAEEGTGRDGHQFDLIALNGLINDPEVNEWLNGMRKAAFLPVKRNEPAR